MPERCLYCYEDLSEQEKDFHKKCSLKIFGKKQPPEVDFLESELESKGLITLNKRKVITGVQLKLSVENEKGKDNTDRLTITGLSGGYILKPQSEKYPNMPELEDLTMHLAEISGIKTVPHSLIRMKSGNLAYITKRIDRTKDNEKIHMEDMCQLSERLTENKYNSSYEQIAKIIKKFTFKELDVINYFEIVLFSFLTANSDMHLKNFSLIYSGSDDVRLSPAYDLLPVKLILLEDKEEMALSLDGKRKKITGKNFRQFFNRTELPEKTFDNILSKYKDLPKLWFPFIQKGFIPQKIKDEYIKIIENNLSRLSLL